MIRLCAFSDEADASLSGQIDALHRNAIALTELRSVGGKNAIIKCAWGATFLYPDRSASVSQSQGTWTLPSYQQSSG
jgi:hypothetical protein